MENLVSDASASPETEVRFLRSLVRTTARHSPELRETLRGLRDARAMVRLAADQMLDTLLNAEEAERLIDELTEDGVEEFTETLYRLTGWHIEASPQIEEAVVRASEEYEDG